MSKVSPRHALKRKASSNNSPVVSQDSDDDIPLVKLKKPKLEGKTVKKVVKKATTSSNKGKTMTKKKKIVSATSKKSGKKKVKVTTSKQIVRKLKVHSKSERLDMAIKAYRWWKSEELPEGIQWRTLEHNGVMFPPSYKPHNIPLLYDGKEVTLTPAQEELASFYAAMPEDGPQLGNPVTAKIFKKNFFQDFKKVLGSSHVIKSLDKCDFSRITKALEKAREEKKAQTKEEKDKEKLKKEVEMYTNGFAMVDGHLEKVGNFRIEPPGLFRGRGEHPKTGTYKERVEPSAVTVNVGISDRVPICNVPGHAWKEVIHRDTVSWLAYWNENVMGGIKYVWLAASSSFKGKSDLAKYDKARRLKKCIDVIRKNYTKGLKASDNLIRQRSTAMWVIDVLALRVGNEKGEDEADTVGCCSLRVEHMTFKDDACEVTLSFLGKDSMPYNNTVKLDKYGDVGAQVYKNLKRFCNKKQPHQEVFHELSVTELNKHLSSLMPGLSAKVFRTFNASITLEKELPKDLDPNGRMELSNKVVIYNDANRKVAILCNHQRTVPKSFEASLEKMHGQLAQLKEQLTELEKMGRMIAKGNTKKFPLKKEIATDDAETKKANSHLFANIPTQAQVAKRIDAWKKKVKATTLKLQDKEDNKEVALGTSKINYMDPRITVAWCKRNEVPISSVFPKALREKFVWAMDVDPNWTF